MKKSIPYLLFLNYFAFLFLSLQYSAKFSLDGLGRLASAKSFWEVGLHGYNDHFFLGNIQNLFYPPAQDFLLGGLWKFLNALNLAPLVELPGITLFIYNQILVLLVLGGLTLFAKKLTSLTSQVFFIIFTSWIFYLDLYSTQSGVFGFLNFHQSPLVLFFQGLGFQDLLITGLSNQFLGLRIFLFFINSLTSKRFLLTTTLLTLCFLSHIIWGAVAFIYILTQIFSNPLVEIRKSATISLVTALGLSSFYWGPLLITSGAMQVESIFPIQIEAFLALCIFTFIFLKPKSPSFPFGLTAFILAALVTIPLFTAKLGFPTPHFHFYRWLAPALLILVLTITLVLEKSSPLSKIKRLAVCLAFIITWIGLFAGRFGTLNYDFFFTNNATPFISDLELKIPPDSRLLVLTPNRPIDFGNESQMFLENKGNLFLKGLYWESAPVNLEISKSFIELMGPPSVLHNFPENIWVDLDCETWANHFQEFVNNAGVELILVEKSTLQSPLDTEGMRKFKTCFPTLSSRWIFSKTTEGHTVYYNHEGTIVKTSDLENRNNIEWQRFNSGRYLFENLSSQTEYIQVAFQYFEGLQASSHKKPIHLEKQKWGFSIKLPPKEKVEVFYKIPHSYLAFQFMSSLLAITLLLLEFLPITTQWVYNRYTQSSRS